MSSLDLSPDTGLLSREKFQIAMVKAHLDAIRENQRFGLPMIYGKDGKVVHVDPFEAEAELRRNHPWLATDEHAPANGHAQ